MRNWLLLFLLLLMNIGLLAQREAKPFSVEEMYPDFFNRVSKDLAVQNDDVLDSTVYFIYNEADSEFERQTKTILYYNNKGLNEKGLVQEWNNGTNSWNDDEQYLNTYDNDGQLSESITQDWMNNSWINTSRQTLTYQNSNLSQLTFSEWENNQWVDQIRISLQYNGDGKVTIRKTEEWKDNKWNNLSRSVSTYDNNGYLVKDINSMWDGGWVEFTQDLYTNNNDGLPTTIETQTSIGPDMWLPSFRTLYSYNNKNLITEETAQFYMLAMDSWDNQSRTTYTYDGDENLTVLLSEFYQGNSYVASERTTYQYDGNNNEIESLNEVWINDQWFKESKLVSYYGSGTTSLVEVADNQYSLIMANPLEQGNNIYFTTDMNEDLMASIRSISGENIKSIIFRNSLNLQISHETPPGFYILSIFTGDRIIISKKFIVL